MQDISIEQAANKFIYSLGNKIDDSSKKAYYADLTQLIKFLGPETDIYSVTQKDLNSYIEQLNVKDLTKKRHQASIRKFFGWLIEKHYIQIDPSHRLNKIKASTQDQSKVETSKTATLLTEEQLNSIFENAKSELSHLYFALLSTCGLRSSDLAKVKIKELDLKNKIIHSGNQIGFILPKVEKLLKKYLDELPKGSIYLFENNTLAKSLSYHYFQQEFKNIIEDQSISSHDKSIVLNNLRDTALINIVSKIGVVQACRILGMDYQSGFRYDISPAYSIKEIYQLLVQEPNNSNINAA